MKIIIVVDDEFWARRSILRLSQEMTGIIIADEFESCTDALTYARENAFDIAIVDILLPDASGFEVGAELKKINCNASVIYISAEESFKEQAEASGAAGFLLKPIKESAFMELIESIVEQRGL